MSTQQQGNLKKKYKGFTLVELIVVITILVILGTIAFVNLGGYSSGARDSTRISNLVNLHKGLILFQIKSGTYPMPESAVNITASGTIIGYQGFAKDQIADIAKLSKGGTVDPSDVTIFTTYSVNADKTKMQAMAFLEDGSTVTSFIPNIPTANASTASDYSKRTPITKGDTLGILLYNTGVNIGKPVQENTSLTGIDLINYTGLDISTVLTNKDFITGTILSKNSSGLVGYWNMENTTMSGTVKVLQDFSSQGNHGLCYNSGTLVDCGTSGLGPQFIDGDGKSGKAINFDGIDDYIVIGTGSVYNFGTGSYSIFTKIHGISQGGALVSKAWAGPYYFYGAGTGKISFTNWYTSTGIINNTYLQDISNSTNINVGVVDKNTNQSKLYMNGLLSSSSDISPYISISMTNINNLAIGANCQSSCLIWRGNFLGGTIDEVRIYNRALSDSEIQVLYNATK